MKWEVVRRESTDTPNKWSSSNNNGKGSSLVGVGSVLWLVSWISSPVYVCVCMCLRAHIFSLVQEEKGRGK